MSSRGVAEKAGLASRPDPRRAPAAFPRTSRLLSRRQFLAVYQQGRKVACRDLVLFAHPNDGGGCRLGITVTRKVGGAVVRNRLKRVLREAFRRHRSRLRPSVDVVINPRRSMLSLQAEEVEAQLLSAFRRLSSSRAGKRP